MSQSLENKRAGREQELRVKMKGAIERFESVFGRALSAVVLKEFLDESEKHNRISFLRDRMGVLSDVDVGYLRNVLKENLKSPSTSIVTGDTTEDEVDSDELPDEDDDTSFEG